jgi:hypothetical protein
MYNCELFFNEDKSNSFQEISNIVICNCYKVSRIFYNTVHTTHTQIYTLQKSQGKNSSGKSCIVENCRVAFFNWHNFFRKRNLWFLQYFIE